MNSPSLYVLAFGWRISSGIRKFQMGLMTLMAVGAVFNVLFALRLRDFIDSPDPVFFNILLLLAMVSIITLVNFICDCGLEISKRKMQVVMWEKMYSRILSANMETFEKRAPGEYMTQVLSDSGYVGAVAGVFIPAIAINVFRFVSYLIALFFLSPVLTMVLLLMLPVFYAVYRKHSKEVLSWSAAEREAYSDVMESLRVRIEGRNTIKSLCAEENALTAFRRDITAWYKRIKSLVIVGRKYAHMYSFLSSIIPLMLLSAGVYLATADPALTLGTIVAFFYLSMNVLGPFATLTTDLGATSQTYPMVRRVEEILHMPPEYEGTEILERARTIELRDVVFSYGDRTVFMGISLAFSEGELVGVVGETGCGKSTLLGLLNGFRRPDSGSVLINDFPVEHYRLRSIRDRIVLVTSRDVIFPGTVYDNITLWKKHPVEEVLRVAEISGVLRDFPNLDEKIGPGAKDISEGQRQRICLARALLKSPDFLLLDEALSGVDSHLETEIMENIRRNYPWMGLIVVSHRLSTIAQMDRVIVLRDGKVQCDGATNRVMQVCGEFHRLMERQMIPA